MRPVLKSVPNEPRPGAEPTRPEPIAASAPTAHLGHCWHCGALNGQSASGCWSCEASLRIVSAEPLALHAQPAALKAEEPSLAAVSRPAVLSDPAPATFNAGNEATIPSARAPGEPRESAHDRWALPVLTMPVDDSEMASQYPGPKQFMVAPAAPRRGWQVPALIAGLLTLVAGGVWLIMAGAARDAQESVATSAAVLSAKPAAQMPDVPAPPVPDSIRPLAPLGADAVQPAAAAHPADPLSIVAAAPPPNSSRRLKTTTLQRSKARAALPELVGSRQPVQAPSARPAGPAGPCTPTVAALGLCTSASN